MKYSLEKTPDSSWLWIKESIIGMVYCACLTVQSSSRYGVKNDGCTRVVRLFSPVHFCFVVFLIKIIITRSFVPPLPFVKPLEQLFSAISHWRAPSALGFVSNASRLVAQGTTYTHVLCVCCKQCTLLCGFFRQNRNNIFQVMRLCYKK